MPETETVFLTPSEQYQFISGTIVRELSAVTFLNFYILRAIAFEKKLER